ncbi:hypothetical protein BJY04DRAFT_182198 [Aspergillus karnatakaensis]|uniref:RNA-binding protein n=1 Tax=Aspergillus karnatakaensis TaxID=1810916 RepID=UPI003CCC9191
MSLARDNARAPRSRGSEEEFVLFLQGIPARCRWQELKDLVRQTALHIRQAVVYDDHHGFPTGLGQIIVKNEDEAWRTYHRLSTNGWEGQSLVVTLARTSSPTRPIAGPTRSPPSMIQPTYVTGYSTSPVMSRIMALPPSPVSTERVVPSSPTYQSTEYGPIPSPIFASQQSFVAIFADPLGHTVTGVPNSPTLQPSFCDPMTFGTIPSYAVSHQMHQPMMANGFRPGLHNRSTPRKSLYNYNNPSAPTCPRQSFRRNIVIQNLNPATTDQDLLAFLQETVTVEHCEVVPMNTSLDTRFTRYRATARVTLGSAEEAKRAVALYNNTTFMRFRIRVRIDRSALQSDPCSLVPDEYAPALGDFSAFASAEPQVQMTPPATESSTSDTDEVIQSHTSSPCEMMERGPTTQPKSADRCQPLVINGSGLGGRTAVST